MNIENFSDDENEYENVHSNKEDEDILEENTKEKNPNVSLEARIFYHDYTNFLSKFFGNNGWEEVLQQNVLNSDEIHIMYNKFKSHRLFSDIPTLEDRIFSCLLSENIEIENMGESDINVKDTYFDDIKGEWDGEKGSIDDIELFDTTEDKEWHETLANLEKQIEINNKRKNIILENIQNKNKFLAYMNVLREIDKKLENFYSKKFRGRRKKKENVIQDALNIIKHKEEFIDIFREERDLYMEFFNQEEIFDFENINTKDYHQKKYLSKK